MHTFLAFPQLTLLILFSVCSPLPASGCPPGGCLASEDEVAPAAGTIPAVVEGGRKRSRCLVLVLHGGSYRPRTSRELAERALAPLEDAGRQLGLRLVAPVLPECLLSWEQRGEIPAGLDSSTIWAGPQGEELVLAFLEQEVRRRRVDPRRVYLAGHGAGATAAIRLASRNPERFAALALWSGTPSPEWAPPEPGQQRSRQPHAARVVGLLDEPVPRLATVGVYLWTGEHDDILDRDALALFVARMRDHEQRGLGHELLWESGPGAHDYGPEGPRAGLEFLKKHRKAAPP